MFDFEKISLKQVSTLTVILSEAHLLKKEFLKLKYCNDAINFDETMVFLEVLRLVELKNNEIFISKKFQDFLSIYINSGFKNQILKNFIINKLIFKKNSFFEYVTDFLNNFILEDEKYRFKAKTYQKIKYSGIRNFLIELGFIEIDSKNNEYIISNKYSEIYKKNIEKNNITLIEFKKLLEEREQIGYDAELRIIKFEKKRLSKLAFLLGKIDHVSQSNVSAGYDIKSFKDELDKNNRPIRIYIEVKAVPIWNYGFIWSRNEINSAKLYRDKYHLYLLPIKGKKIFDIGNLKIIENPYDNVYKNKKSWFCTEELLSFSLIK